MVLAVVAWQVMSTGLRAQAPQAVTLQSVLRDASGRLVANRTVNIRITLNRSSISGPVIYRESHTTTTNQNGLYTVLFGQGTPMAGEFDEIDWGKGPYYATVEADPNGGNDYSLSISHPIVSVPYAIYADAAASADAASKSVVADTAKYYEEHQQLSLSNDTIYLTGGSYVKLPAMGGGSDNDSLVNAINHKLDSMIQVSCIATYNYQEKTACNEYDWDVDQKKYTGSGVYSKVIERGNKKGCDSVILLKLTIKHSSYHTETQSVTGQYTWHGTIYTESNTYTHEYNNTEGCPSVDTLHLTVSTAGTLPGEFTINSSGKKVKFSQGNLQYRASTYQWRFATNQYDVVYNGNATYNNNVRVGTTLSDNRSISATYTGWIDLFGWGTSGVNSLGYDVYNQRYKPTDYATGAIATTTYNYYGYGPSTNVGTGDLTGLCANSDWGVPNIIDNGGNQAGLWRTLTQAEWNYLLQTRSASTVNGYSNARYCFAQIARADGYTSWGIIIFPDNYKHPEGITQFTRINNNGYGYSTNVIQEAKWKTLEAAGLVFLPTTGYRSGTSLYNPTYGYYWTATHSSSSPTYYAYYIYIADGGYLYTSTGYYTDRYRGHAVRLVQDVSNK
ncbi:MAG: hypothetical protein IJ764_00585 [Bacteroidales bacterium]|nr:hypothetical protein [Bacteroidales bacterium]